MTSLNDTKWYKTKEGLVAFTITILFVWGIGLLIIKYGPYLNQFIK